jgi:D-alanyl-D-alanine carboxypeptidase
MPRLVAESTAFVQNTVVYDSSEEKALSQATIRQEEDEILSDWRLILVNPWNFLPSTYSVSLVEIENEQSVDERCASELQEMLADCRLAGYSPFICSSYRSYEKQEQLYNNKVNKLIARGYSESEAKKEAATVNAVPGTSEHQLGLAVDIVDKNYQELDEEQEDTAVQKWLMSNSWKYGFILRYPNEKSEITGIIYEPWHYRYVGKEAAKEIYESGMCLEEYLESLK